MRAHPNVVVAGLMAGVLSLAACADTGMEEPAAGPATPLPADSPTAPAPASPESSPTPPETSPTTPAPTESPGVEDTEGARLLAFEARGLDGGTVDGGELVGSDVILWMWAPW